MHYTPNHSFHYTKSQWRTWALAWHNSLNQSRRAEWDATIQQTLTQHLLTCLRHHPKEDVFTLGVFAPLRNEVNLWPFYQTCFQEAALRRVVLVAPRIEAERTLSWHTYSPEIPDFWEATAFGLQQPSQRLPALEPSLLDALLIPCQMMDYTGIRLGYGGGYYDRQFALWQRQGVLPKQRIGIVYHECVIRELPHEAHDVRLSHCITEAGLYQLQG